MERVVLIAALKPGARDQALDLLQRSAAGGEPEPVTQRQGIFLSERAAVFFFEGRDGGASVRELINDPVRSTMLSPWLRSSMVRFISPERRTSLSAAAGSTCFACRPGS